ncbi:MAG: hypothetical protein IKU80_04775 [Firmicutes bacterium]|nr:hypothetical protein [Bacillota bacterium]
MENFWDYSVWATYNVIAILLISLLVANILKRRIPLLQASLIPTSVLGGGIIIVVAGVYKIFTGNIMFDEPFFAGRGTATLELLTYHTLALGFIASTFKSSEGKLSKQRTVEIFNTGVTTVATYLLQAIIGVSISMLAAVLMKDFFAAAGVLLPFGYGQGTGQALNYGNMYETQFGFAGGKSFGLTIAALGFLSASIGGVIHLNILRKSKKITITKKVEGKISSEEIQSDDEIPMQESIDKMTVQIALIAVAYVLTYLIMLVLGNMVPGMKSIVYGFNFLLGVLSTTVVKFVMRKFRKVNLIHRQYINNFLMTRASNLFFDIMVVSGVAAIRLSVLEDYWGVILIMGVAGLVVTYIYNYIVAKTLFKDYAEEQFLTMFGMLTGTASTGIILLREIDGEFKSPASDNMVYQNFPAIAFGFPMMILATMAPVKLGVSFAVFVAYFVVMNIILFRSILFKKLKRK